MARRRSPADLDDFYIESRSKRFFRRFFKRVRRFFYFILFLCVALVFFFPTLMSTEQGKKVVTDVINTQIPGSVSLEGVYLNWFGEQTLSGLELRTPDKRLVMRASEVQVKRGLFDLFSSRKSIGELRLVSPVANVIYDEEGKSNLERALMRGRSDETRAARSSLPSAGEDFQVAFLYTGRLEIENGRLTLIQPNVDKVSFSSIQADVQFAQKIGPMIVNISGISQQGDLSGRFDIQGLARGFNPKGELNLLASESGLYRTEIGSEIDFRAELSNLPLEAIDQIISLKYPKNRGFVTGALGKQMDLVALVNLNSDNIQIELQANSPTLIGQISGITHEGVFQLTEPGEIQLAVTPLFFDQLGSVFALPEGLRLRQASSLQFQIEQLEVPLPQGHLELPALRFDGRLALQDAQIVGDVDFGQLSLRNTRAAISTEKLSEEVKMNFKSDLNYNFAASEVTAAMRLEEVMDDSGRLTPEATRGEVSVLAGEVPVPVIDEWLALDGALVEAIGTQLNLSMKTDIQGQESRILFGASSQNFRLSDAEFDLTERLTLAKPVKVDYKLSSALASDLIASRFGGRVEGEIPLEIEVTHFSIPRLQKRGRRLAPEEVQLRGRILVAPFALENVPQVGKLMAKEGVIEVSGEHLADVRLNVESQIQPSTESWLAQNSGGELKLVGSSQLEKNSRGVMDFIDAKVALESEGLTFKIHGDFENNDYMSLRSPVQLNMTLTPEEAARWGLGRRGLPAVVAPSQMELAVQPFEAALSDWSWQNSRLTGVAKFDLLELQFSQSAEKNLLHQATVNWRYSGPANAVEVDIDALAMSSEGAKEQSGDLALTFFAEQFLQEDGFVSVDEAGLLIKAEGEDLPVSFVESVTKQPHLHRVLGERVSGYFNVRLTETLPPRGVVAFDLSGEDLSTSGAFAITDTVGLLSPETPFLLSWKVTPERFDVVRDLLGGIAPSLGEAVADLELMEKMDLAVRFREFEAPLPWLYRPFGNLTVRLGNDRVAFFEGSASDVVLNGDVSISGLRLKEPELNQELSFDTLKTFVMVEDITDQLSFGVSAQGELLGGKERTGKKAEVVLKGQLSDLLNEDETGFNWLRMSAKAWLSVKNFPVLLAGDFFRLPPEYGNRIQALFGETLDSYSQMDVDRMSGPITVKIQSSNSRGQIDGELIEGVLHLKEDAQLQLAVTPQMGKEILKDFNPLLQSAVSSDEMVAIQFEAGSFQVPVVPPNIAAGSFDQATIRVGKVELANAGMFGQVIDLMALQRFADSESLEVWFTPIRLSMKGGIVSVKRTDFLIADYFHLASWGRVDLATDRVRMIVGFTSEALRNAFLIKGLPEQYLFQIPIRGSTGNLSYDAEAVEMRLAELYLKAYDSRKSRLDRGVIEAIGYEDQEGIPPATVETLPWGHRDPVMLGEPGFHVEPDHPSVELDRDHPYNRFHKNWDKMQKNKRDFRNFLNRTFR